MSVDYKWMSQGGLLTDGSGDIAFTSSPTECAIAMVRTRLKSAVDGWKLYQIGAGLDDFPGDTSDAAMEITIKRRVMQAITRNYLPSSVFDITTLRFGGEIQVYVYMNQNLVATASVQVVPTAN